MPNWVVPTVADLKLVLVQPALDKAGSIGANETKLQDTLSLVVDSVRNLIRNNSRTHQISLTAGSVPPEGKNHVLVLAARQLIDSVPTMTSAIDQKDQLYDTAKDWLDYLRLGGSVTPPDDPSPATVDGPSSNQNYVDLTLAP